MIGESDVAAALTVLGKARRLEGRMSRVYTWWMSSTTSKAHALKRCAGRWPVRRRATVRQVGGSFCRVCTVGIDEIAELIETGEV